MSNHTEKQYIQFLSETEIEKILGLLAIQGNPQTIQQEIIEIYNGGKRHNYSFVTSYIIKKVESQTLSIICENLINLIELFENNQNNQCKISLQKLYDHINLELIRLNYTKTIEDDLLASKHQLEEIQIQSQAIKEDLRKQQTQYITILGIFASIVLAFVGGLTFSSSVLENMHNVSIYRLVFVMCFIALLFGNILYILFSFLAKIALNNKNNDIINKKHIIVFNCLILLIMFLITFTFFVFHYTQYSP